MRIKALYTLALAMVTLISCSEADREMFDTDFAAISFATDSISDDNVVNKDSVLVFTFAPLTPDITDYELNVPVIVTGEAKPADRSFIITVDQTNTTAHEGYDYEALKTSYTMAGGQYRTVVPIKLLRNKDLQNNQKQIALKLVSGADFPDQPIAEKSKIILQFSDQLVKPTWWDYWILWFGKFSRTKYQRWLVIYGKDETALKETKRKMSNYAFMAPKVAVAQNELRDYFINHPTYDEEGELITVPALQ